MAQGNNRKLLTKKIRKGDKGYPVATIAYYGPTNTQATKVVCSMFANETAEPEPMKKWFSKTEIRKSERTTGEILQFIAENNAKTVAMTDGILGCPHEEGTDYPDGGHCSACHYWRNRDRFGEAKLH